MDVAVAIISVPRRAAVCAATVAAWRAQGFEPRVLVTPSDWTPSPLAQGRMARTALASVAAETVILCEDDVLLDPRLVLALPTVCACRQVVTLYLPGRRFTPTRCPTGQLSLRPIRQQCDWFGSQCLVIPGAWRAKLAALPEPATPRAEQGGFDIRVRDWLAATGRRLYTVVPNLVQHRTLPSVTSRRYQAHQSTSFGLPWREPAWP